MITSTTEKKKQYVTERHVTGEAQKDNFRRELLNQFNQCGDTVITQLWEEPSER